MKTTMTVIAIALLTGLVAVDGAADTIVLKNGEVLSGQVIESADSDQVLLVVPNGKVAFNRSEIAEIRRDDAVFDVGEGALTGRGKTEPEPPGEDGKAGDEEKPPYTEEQKRLFLHHTRALDKVNEECADYGLNKERAACIKAIVKIGPDIAILIERRFLKGDPESSPYLLMALFKLDSKGAVKLAQSAALMHKDSTMRMRALEALGDGNPKQNEAIFRKAFHDKQGNVRAAAVYGLGSTKNAENIPVLITALSDAVVSVRYATVWSLQQCVPEQAGLETEGQWLAWAAEQPGGKSTQ